MVPPIINSKNACNGNEKYKPYLIYTTGFQMANILELTDVKYIT